MEKIIIFLWNEHFSFGQHNDNKQNFALPKIASFAVELSNNNSNNLVNSSVSEYNFYCNIKGSYSKPIRIIIHSSWILFVAQKKSISLY